MGIEPDKIIREHHPSREGQAQGLTFRDVITLIAAFSVVAVMALIAMSLFHLIAPPVEDRQSIGRRSSAIGSFASASAAPAASRGCSAHCRAAHSR
jgi:hypothetical protein